MALLVGGSRIGRGHELLHEIAVTAFHKNDDPCRPDIGIDWVFMSLQAPPSEVLVLPPAIGRVCWNHNKTATSHASSIHCSRASHPPSGWIVIFFRLPLSAMPRASFVPSPQSRNFAAAHQHPNGNCSQTCQPRDGALSSRCETSGQNQK